MSASLYCPATRSDCIECCVAGRGCALERSENVGGIPLGDLSKSPPRVLCPITRMDCTQGCVNECVSGTLRTPAPRPRQVLPYGGAVNYEHLLQARIMLADIGSQLSSHDGSYREGLCSERCEHAARAVGSALEGLALFLDDEAAAAVLAPRKGTT